MNYTKGEWKILKHGITSAIWADKYCVTEKIYNKANAKLICTAPEMYEALKDVLQAASFCHADAGLKIWIDKAKQALAKAEGRTNHASKPTEEKSWRQKNDNQAS